MLKTVLYNNKKGKPDAQSDMPYIVTVAILKNLTYLSRSKKGMDLAPFPIQKRMVAKASQGQFPLPFWISDVKNLVQI